VTGTAPIALFTYSRPAHAAHVVKSLLRNREAADSELFVFSDAAKTPDDAASVAAVRKLIASVQGFRRIELIERDRNLGLAGSIVEGVTRLCASHGRAIVVEDDIVVSPFFLRYMNEALERYSGDDRVISIGRAAARDVLPAHAGLLGVGDVEARLGPLRARRSGLARRNPQSPLDATVRPGRKLPIYAHAREPDRRQERLMGGPLVRQGLPAGPP
jgi:hypothetical protein